MKYSWFWLVTRGVKVRDLRISFSEAVLPSKRTPEEEERQRVIFLCEVIELNNCDEKELRDLPKPSIPFAPVDKPFKRKVFDEQVKSSSKFESFVD